MKNKHYLHGGDVDAAAKLYNLDRNKIWDFSGNINPFGTSPKARETIIQNVDLISTYPDKTYCSLRSTLAEYGGCDASHILVGNGTSELISLVIQTLKPNKTITLAPTYSEYEREIQLIGGELEYYMLEPENEFILDTHHFCNTLTSDTQLLIICNPNNPTSTVLDQKQLTSILSHCQAHNIFVMVDETYIEFCDNPLSLTAIPLVTQFNNLLILRGISKFFSAPGLRFGYGICSNLDLLNIFKEKQNPWCVNILAALAAESMFQDTEYIHTTHKLFITERKRITEELLTWKSIHVFIPHANFVLLKLIDTPFTGTEIATKLIQDNILIRDASSFPTLNETYIRFCFLAPTQNDELLNKLKILINHEKKI